MAVAGGFFLEAISAPDIYTKMLKSYPTEEILIIFMGLSLAWSIF